MSLRHSTVSFKFSACLNNTLRDNRVTVEALQDEGEQHYGHKEHCDRKSDV